MYFLVFCLLCKNLTSIRAAAWVLLSWYFNSVRHVVQYRTLGSTVTTEPLTYMSIRFIFHGFFLAPQQRILHKCCGHEFPAMKVLFLRQKFFIWGLTSTCLFNHICSFQTAFQGDEMILLSAISVQRPPAPHTPRTARLIFSVNAWGWSPVSGVLESAFPPRLRNLNVFTCLSMNCSSVNCLFMSTFLLALKNLFFVNFQEPLVYYR